MRAPRFKRSDLAVAAQGTRRLRRGRGQPAAATAVTSLAATQVEMHDFLRQATECKRPAEGAAGWMKI
jgi:hypothetical protein